MSDVSVRVPYSSPQQRTVQHPSSATTTGGHTGANHTPKMRLLRPALRRHLMAFLSSSPAALNNPPVWCAGYMSGQSADTCTCASGSSSSLFHCHKRPSWHNATSLANHACASGSACDTRTDTPIRTCSDPGGETEQGQAPLAQRAPATAARHCRRPSWTPNLGSNKQGGGAALLKSARQQMPASSCGKWNAQGRLPQTTCSDGCFLQQSKALAH